MPSKQLYTQYIPSDSQIETSGTARRDTLTEGVIRGAASAATVSIQPGQRLLRGQYRGQNAGVMAREIEELFDAPGYEAVPFFTPDDPAVEDGYYVLKNVTSNPVKPQAEGTLHAFDGVLERTGSRRSHWRAVETSPGTVDNDFGNDEKPHVGINSNATLARWFDAESQATEDATVTSTLIGEHGTADLYDPGASSYTAPSIIYGLAYDQEGKLDCRVWDELSAGAKVQSGNVEWQKCYVPGHDFIGDAVLDNDLLRVTLDDDTSTLSAEEWDSGASSWSSITLGTSDWVLTDADIAEIAPAEVRTQLTFRDTTDDSLFALDARLIRGWERVLFSIPQNETGPTPSGLVDLLGPIASTRGETATPTSALVKRKEVRK